MLRWLGILAVVALVAGGVSGGMFYLLPSVMPVAGLGSVSNVPSAINHQGVVTVSGKRFTGTGSFKFAIVDPDTGNNVWTNDGSRMSPPAQTGEPDNGVSLTVTDGMYSVALGGGSMTAISPGLFADGNLVLRIWFNDGTHNWQQLSPDHTLTSVPYAMAIADQAVTSVKLASGVAIPPGAILMWSGSTTDIPAGWTLCNGQNGTPDLRNRFVVGAGGNYAVASTGGADSVTLTVNQMPSHTHLGYHNRPSTGQVSFSTVADQTITTDYTSTQGTVPAGGNAAHEHRPP